MSARGMRVYIMEWNLNWGKETKLFVTPGSAIMKSPETFNTSSVCVCACVVYELYRKIVRVYRFSPAQCYVCSCKKEYTYIQAMIANTSKRQYVSFIHTYTHTHRQTVEDREMNSLKWQEVSNKQQMFTSHTCIAIEIGPTEFGAHSFDYRTTFLSHSNKKNPANVTAI